MSDFLKKEDIPHLHKAQELITNLEENPDNQELLKHSRVIILAIRDAIVALDKTTPVLQVTSVQGTYLVPSEGNTADEKCFVIPELVKGSWSKPEFRYSPETHAKLEEILPLLSNISINRTHITLIAFLLEWRKEHGDEFVPCETINESQNYESSTLIHSATQIRKSLQQVDSGWKLEVQRKEKLLRLVRAK
jgi:hypothetical protein